MGIRHHMKILDDYKGTALLSVDSGEDLNYAADLIRQGELVGIPTETVYGLAANALDAKAVKKIFEAKGRPSDNPLIVHIAEMSDLEKLVHDVPDVAYKLAENFWCGPLTMILPKNDCIPYETSGGLETVGIRMPAAEFTRNLIKKSGCPLAAPSANISGYPSPTKAIHVCRDLAGKIKAVADGGICTVGLESTVISFENDGKIIRILRPGYITPEKLSEFAEVITDKAVVEGLSEGEHAASPGMKYKHYSPKADIIMVEGSSESFEKYIEQFDKSIDIYGNDCDSIYIVAFDGEAENYNGNIIYYGATEEMRARNLFSVLRELDDLSAKKVYIHSPEKEGVGLAVYNRLIRAAGFEVVRL